MSTTGLSALRYFSKEQQRRYEQALDRRRKLQRRKKMHRKGHAAAEETEARFRQSQDDLASMLLLGAGVRQALLEAGALDKADLAEAVRRMDLLDGVADGKLDPAATRPPPPPALSTEEYLRRLAEDD